VNDNVNQFESVQRPKKKKTHKKLVVVIVILVTVMISIGIWLYTSSVKVSISPKPVIMNRQLLDTKQKLDAQANSGDVNGSLKAYDIAIANTSNSLSKRSLLISQAVVAFNNHRLNETLKSLQLADAIKSDYNTLGFIARVYDQMGNAQKAIEFYNKAADYKSEFNFDSSNYKARAIELEDSING